MHDQVVVGTFSYRHEAEFWKSVLDGHGIAAWVVADDAGAIHPAMALASGVRLCVAEADAAQAAEILDVHRAADEAGRSGAD
jgi:hypothetical protein